MSMIFSLPTELKLTIAEFCSPNTLAILARTHTVYQVEAEQTLYRTLTLHPPFGGKCLETLASNSQKAGYVRLLRVDDREQRMVYLAQALINMHSLYDLRLRTNLYDHATRPWLSKLETILCGGHFRLRALFCRDSLSLNISRIFKSQTELQIFGIYNFNYPHILLEALKQFYDAQLFLPMVFTVEGDQHVGIFPGFYTVDRIATIHRELVESLDQDPMYVHMNEVTQLSIYLIDSNMSTIHTLAKQMSVIFPQISKINFFFERQCNIPPREMKGVLSCFFNLRHLNLCLWNHRYAADSIPERHRLENVNEWKFVYPQLASVFMNGLLHFRV